MDAVRMQLAARVTMLEGLLREALPSVYLNWLSSREGSKSDRLGDLRQRIEASLPPELPKE